MSKSVTEELREAPPKDEGYVISDYKVDKVRPAEPATMIPFRRPRNLHILAKNSKRKTLKKRNNAGKKIRDGNHLRRLKKSRRIPSNLEAIKEEDETPSKKEKQDKEYDTGSTRAGWVTFIKKNKDKQNQKGRKVELVGGKRRRKTKRKKKTKRRKTKRKKKTKRRKKRRKKRTRKR